MRSRVLLVLGWSALFSCGEDVAFLPLNELCPELAGDICEARDGCCNQPDVAACQAAETGRCDAVVGAIVHEASLRYESVHAASQRSAARRGLDVCGPVPGIAQFFKGGLALGLACERDAQCASGLCAGEPRTCQEAPLAPLCPAP